MADDAGKDVVMQATEEASVVEPSSSLFRHVDEDTFPKAQPSLDLGVPVTSTEDDMQQDSHDTSSGSSGPLSSTTSSMDEDILDETFPYTPPNGAQTFQIVIPPGPKLKALPYSTSQSGLVYDVRMRFHTEIVSYEEVANDFHPEDPRRIHEIYMELKDAGLVADELADETPETIEEDRFKLWRIQTREATWEEISAVHTRNHYDWVKGLTRT